MSIDGVVQFLTRHQEWSFWVALVFATAETTAFISIIVPSTVLLVAVGATVATGALSFPPIWAGASLGSVLGSSLSWWLGRRYGGAILRAWPMRNHPDLAERAAESFRRWGLPAVFIGHFVGPLRPVVFLFAGMTGVGFWRFQLMNVPGSLLWAWVVPTFGEVGGRVLGWLWHLVF